jgi:hypothetical protein
VFCPQGLCSVDDCLDLIFGLGYFLQLWKLKGQQHEEASADGPGRTRPGGYDLDSLWFDKQAQCRPTADFDNGDPCNDTNVGCGADSSHDSAARHHEAAVNDGDHSPCVTPSNHSTIGIGDAARQGTSAPDRL